MLLMLAFIPFNLPAQENADSTIQLEEAIICRSIENRTPIASASVFSDTVGQLFCFTKVVGATTDTAIIHHWYLNGKLKASITLPVRSASWRTWSSKKITPGETGDWMVEVVTEDGNALESILFLVQ
jgi:hypothetical protein